MGKRKSKIGKQQQAKAKSKNNGKGNKSSTVMTSASTLGGVMVSKGAGSKMYQGKQMSMPTTNNNNNNGSSSNASHLAHQQQQQIKQAQQKRRRNMMTTNFATPKPTTARSTEMEDFQREQLSMQEREMAKSKPRSKNKKKQQTQVAPINFSSASFSLQKSTDQMLDETADKIEGMQGVGMANHSVPAQINQDWMLPQENEEPMNQNPFAALETNSDDESNDWETAANETKPQPVTTMQFAPSSFAPKIEQSTQVLVGEDDPDL